MNDLLERGLTAYLLLFAADGVLSVVDELAGGALGGLRALVAGLVVFFSVFVLAALVVVRAIPKRKLVPPLLFLAWTAGMAMPLPLWFGLDGFGLPMSVVQVVVAALVLVRPPPAGWIAPVRLKDGPLFTWPHLLIAGAVLGIGLPIGTLVYLGASAGAALNHLTAGYADVGWFGVQLEERTLEKDGVAVRLIGMMHIGDEEAYDALYATFPDDGCLILTEGVTDVNQLLPRFDYSNIARTLGLTSQPEVGLSAGPPEPPKRDPRIRHADVDVSTFDDHTLELLNELGSVLDAPDRAAMLLRYNQVVGDVTDADILRVMDDLLDHRNEHLLAKILEATQETQLIIVPWGALHLKWIEEQLVAHGFEETARSKRDHIRWGPG